MAINSLQLPGQFQSPQVDLQGSLANLGQVYQQAQKQSAVRDLFSNAQIDPNDPKSLSDLAARAYAVDPQMGMSLSQLATSANNTQYQRGRDTTLDARHEREYAQDLALRRSAAARANDTTPAGFYKNPDGSVVPIPGGPTDPTYQARLLKARAEAEASAPGSGGASLTPVWGTDANGNPSMIQPTKSGRAIQTELPPGFKIAKEPIRLDLGTSIQLIDPQTRQPIGPPIPKDLAGVEREKLRGEETEKARLALPQVKESAALLINNIDGVLNHPGLKYGVGMAGAIPAFPGSQGADFNARAAQLKGSAFLQAYQTLRGSGAITDIEGKKGEDAIARLDRAQSEGEYRVALQEFKNIVKTGLLRSSAKAGGGQSETAASTIPAADPLGIR